MTDYSDLIPELGQWNDGRGITPADWIFCTGKADQALGYCTLAWPEFVEFEGYVLRSPVAIERLRAWERMDGAERHQVEAAMNATLLEGIFPKDVTGEDLKAAQCRKLMQMLMEMTAAKLGRDFPNRRFSVFALEDDFGFSFHQV